MSNLVSPEMFSASETVVDRIANDEGVDPAELSPLFDAIDPDALDAIIESANRRDTAVQIEFSYHGYDVTVAGDGGVHVTKQSRLH